MQGTVDYLSKLPVSQSIYIVERKNGTKTDGSTWWYTLWSDGWCEQGGKRPTTVAEQRATLTINFSKPFANTDYTLLLTKAASGYSTDDTHVINEVQGSRTTSRFGFAYTDMNGSTHDAFMCWKAEGYTQL